MQYDPGNPRPTSRAIHASAQRERARRNDGHARRAASYEANIQVDGRARAMLVRTVDLLRR
jgi:flagellar basal body rod protein FlgC